MSEKPDEDGPGPGSRTVEGCVGKKEKKSKLTHIVDLSKFFLTDNIT